VSAVDVVEYDGPWTVCDDCGQGFDPSGPHDCPPVRRFRTYETFAIKIARPTETGGSYTTRITGYRSFDEATAAAVASSDPAEVERTTFEVELSPRGLALGVYQPGVGADRFEVVS
jgi:hypothetical protein